MARFGAGVNLQSFTVDRHDLNYLGPVSGMDKKVREILFRETEEADSPWRESGGSLRGL